MTDVFGQTAPTTTYDRTGYEPTAADRPGYEPTAADRTGTGPSVGRVQVEEPRRHPLTYAALALSLLALILSIAALARGGDNGVSRVRVGNNDCVSVAQDTGPNALYCRTAALPNG